jgi:26S proteasome regulatory subunit N3
LEYSDAQASLIQALRKGPEVGALGFRIQVQKLLVIVELLMGEIPQRSVFA